MRNGWVHRLSSVMQARLPPGREARWRAQILVGFFVLQLVVSLGLLPVLLLSDTPEIAWLVLISEVLYAASFGVALGGRSWALGGTLSVLVMMGIVVAGLFLQEGVHASAVAALMAVVLTAALLSGRHLAAGVGGLSAVLVLVEGLVLLPWQTQSGDAISDVVTSAAMFGLVVALVWVMEHAQTRGFRALEDALQRAEAGVRAKDTFLATMSHEIRTPLNGILGLAQVLAHTTLDAEQQSLLGTLRSSGEALQHTLNDVLDYSRLEAGQLTLERQPFSPVHLAQEVVDLFAAHSGARGLTLRCVVAPTVPDRVLGDAFRLRQILLNLLGNAVKFTEQGSVIVGVQYAAGVLGLSVADTGIGIEADRLAALFEPFTQAESSTTRRFGGSGLGLTICQRLVVVMGGQIEVHSQIGQGTCFTVRLALPVYSGPPTGPRATSPETAAVAPMLRGRVLVVEDNAINQLVVARLLRRWGLEVSVANDGIEALEQIAASVPFDFILMDQFMPRLDGLATVRQLRAQGGWLRAVPIVACTASVSPADQENCRAAGMDDVIAKPIDEKRLLAILSRTLPQHTPPTES